MLTTVNQKTIGERMPQVLDGRWIGAASAVAAATGALAVAAATVVPTLAYAGQWMRTTCTSPDGSPAGSDGWSSRTEGSPPFGSVSKTTCGPNDPMGASIAMPFAAHPPDAEILTYAPPLGSTLAGGTLFVGITANGTGVGANGSVGIFTPNLAGSTDNLVFLCGLSKCARPNAALEPTPYVGTIELPRDRGGSIYLAAACVGSDVGECNSGGYNGQYWSSISLGWANILLTSEKPPTATGFGGSLLDADAHGTAGLAFTAEDEGPGVYRVNVAIDGAAVYDGTPNTNTGKCVPGGTDATTGALYFQWQQPCLRSQTVDLAIRTTSLPDGPHELKVTLLNAGQDASTVLRRTITTKNLTTVASALTSDKPAPVGVPAPEYAVVLDAPTKKLVRGVSTRWSRSGLRLAGTLRNTAGVPAPGVPMTLFARNGGQGAAVAVTRSTTDAAGRWVVAAPARALTATHHHVWRSARSRIAEGHQDPSDRQAGPHVARPGARTRAASLQRQAEHQAIGQSASTRRHPDPDPQRQALAGGWHGDSRQAVRRVLGCLRRGTQRHRWHVLVSNGGQRYVSIRDRHLADPSEGGPLMPSKSRRANRYGLLIAVMSALPLVLVAVASAASPAITMQAAAANAAFLAYAPPPVGGAKALCLVDTGVNATPDTTPGLLSAIALDGGSPNDVDPLWHGTIDAAVAGGAGHGVLGAWPLLKIVSVRATSVPSPGQHPTFQFDDYINGINKCTQTRAARH